MRGSGDETTCYKIGGYLLREVAAVLMLRSAAASAAETLVTWKHSRTSPTFTSLKLAMPAPHSNPVRTSLTSSLKRFKELSLEVYTTTLSRTTRICASRLSTPSTT